MAFSRLAASSQTARWSMFGLRANFATQTREMAGWNGLKALSSISVKIPEMKARIRWLSTETPTPSTSTLRSRLQQDLKEAMKNRTDKDRLSAIRSVVSAITYADKHNGQAVDDDTITREIRKIVRKHEESIEEFLKAGREDSINEERSQLNVVKSYLPAEIPLEKVEELVKEAISATSAKSVSDMKKILQHLETNAANAGALSRKTVSEVVKKLLSAQK